MRAHRLHIPTLREPPRDAEVISHALLVRAGFVRRAAAGIYSFLPMGMRILDKIKRIIRDELDRAGAEEVLLPLVVPAELWQESGRWQEYGPELLRLTDRKGGEFCLGPTHEEAVVDLVRRDVRSYKQLPINLYQIQNKFRDEMRPRAGLMRGREFIMKDAYSFDADEAGAKVSYQAMFDAYGRIFSRMGLDFRPVEADTGNIGGTLSHEFQVLAESGEDAIVSCNGCDFAANVEMAPLPAPPPFVWDEAAAPPSVVDTPGCKTIEAVCAFLNATAEGSVKAVCFDADGQPVVAFVRGDRDVNEVKVKRALGATLLQLADAAWFGKTTRLPTGYLGPMATGELRVLVDNEVAAMATAVIGANAVGKHRVDAIPARDFGEVTWADLRMAVAGDPCPRCDGQLRAFRGIEVGHVFSLGTKYSEAMHATFLDEGGREKPFVMGCYGIGVSRILSAAVEQNHDDRGITWPVAIAPFEVVLVAIARDEAGAEVAEALYAQLRERGVSVVLDDRKARPGVKFKDAELVGYPLQITVGRQAVDGIVEMKVRAGGERQDVSIEGLVDRVATAIAAARDGSPLRL